MNQAIRPTRENLQQLSHDELVGLVLTLVERIEQLMGRISELEGQTNKTSKNSHKPPSSDGLKRQAAQPRQAGQRPTGGQPGHKGHSLEMSPSPDYIEYCHAEGTCECGLPLSEAEVEEGERRQQWDIPAPRMLRQAQHKSR